MRRLGVRGWAIAPWAAAVAVALGAPDVLFCEPLAELDAARRTRHDIAALAAAPAIEVPSVAIAEESITAPDAAAAAAAAEGAIRRVAAKAGVLIERLDVSGEITPDSALRLHLLASGKEKAVLRFASELQAVTPLLAMPSWDLSSSEVAGTLRLDAQILSAWQQAG